MNLSERLNQALGLESKRGIMSFHQRTKFHPPNEVPVREGGQSTKGPSQSTKEPTYGAYRGSASDKDKSKKTRNTKTRDDPDYD